MPSGLPHCTTQRPATDATPHTPASGPVPPLATPRLIQTPHPAHTAPPRRPGPSAHSGSARRPQPTRAPPNARPRLATRCLASVDPRVRLHRPRHAPKARPSATLRPTALATPGALPQQACGRSHDPASQPAPQPHPRRTPTPPLAVCQHQQRLPPRHAPRSGRRLQPTRAARNARTCLAARCAASDDRSDHAPHALRPAPQRPAEPGRARLAPRPLQQALWPLHDPIPRSRPHIPPTPQPHAALPRPPTPAALPACAPATLASWPPAAHACSLQRPPRLTASFPSSSGPA